MNDRPRQSEAVGLSRGSRMLTEETTEVTLKGAFPIA
jgi:hypothetical protein